MRIAWNALAFAFRCIAIGLFVRLAYICIIADATSLPTQWFWIQMGLGAWAAIMGTWRPLEERRRGIYG